MKLSKIQKELYDRIDEVAKERRNNLGLTPDMAIEGKAIGCYHTVCFELVQIIRTEDKINTIHELSKEIKEYNDRTSKEWMDTVVEPLCKNILEFLDKHPQYCIKTVENKSFLATFKGLILQDLKTRLSEALAK